MSKKGYLSAEEYRAIRTVLGLTQEEAQKLHKVQNRKTIQRWENGDSFVSELACDTIMSLFKTINAQVNETCDMIQEHFENLPEEEWQTSVLIVYPDSCYKQYIFGMGDLPNSIHKTMVNRIYTEMNELGYPVGIITFNPQAYFTFLASNGLQDCHESRSAWAAQAYSEV